MGVRVYAHVALAVVAIPLAMIDLREHRLPDRLTLPLWGGSVVLSQVAREQGLALEQAVDGVVASAIAVLVLWLGAEAPGKPLGFGDVKLGGALSVQMGWYGIEWALWGLALAVVFGGIWALWSMSRGHIGPRDSIPFGPWMLIGAIVVLLRVG